MAIIDMFKEDKFQQSSSEVGFLQEVSFAEDPSSQQEGVKKTWSKDSLISALCIRLFFLVLFFCCLVWLAYTLCKIAFFFPFKLCLGKGMFSTQVSRAWLSLKRSVICAIALLLATVSPALGIMIACAYFLMFDKKGVDEVVPASLREQFKDLFSQNERI